MKILDALPKDMSSLVDTFYNNDPLPVSSWLWMRLLERELADRKRETSRHRFLVLDFLEVD